MRRRRARERVAAPVPPGLVPAPCLRGAVAVRRRGQGEGQRDDRLAGSVEQLDFTALQVLSAREGVDPSRSLRGDAGGRVRGTEHVGLTAGEAGIRGEADRMPSLMINRRTKSFKEEGKNGL